MSVTAKLQRLFEIEKQLRGLRSRLRAAERFLTEQVAQLDKLDAQKAGLETTLKQLRAKSGTHEGEAKQFEEKIAKLREQMNNAQTNKEYKAFLLEINGFTAEKDKEESAALELLSEADKIEAELAEIDGKRDERATLRTKAESDRAEREQEIAGRLSELEDEYAKRASEVPAEAMAVYQELLTQDPDEDPMAPIEIQDRKRHEYTCGACMMTIPMEPVVGLLSHGGLFRCPSCQVILYLEEETAQKLQPS
ncbi:MAG: hypothetical protein AAGG07_11395 [Planctomycetota bacterium]